MGRSMYWGTFVCMCISNYSRSFIEKTVLSSLNSLCTFVENWLSVYVWVCLSTLCSVSLIYLSIVTPIPHCIDYCINYLISGSVSRPTLIFIFKSVLAIPGPSHFYVNFKISLSVSTKKLAFRLKVYLIYRPFWGELIL